ncbi:MAG: UTP--glucose-1-phosphate uridylyltransferase, partial [Candidatus Omnitrophica bacterium]|nr:UTP--glucose-1-phosphate uridylyltransferase [Candidatus Omnitrophota bacterium]
QLAKYIKEKLINLGYSYDVNICRLSGPGNIWAIRIYAISKSIVFSLKDNFISDSSQILVLFNEGGEFGVDRSLIETAEGAMRVNVGERIDTTIDMIQLQTKNEDGARLAIEALVASTIKGILLEGKEFNWEKLANELNETNAFNPAQVIEIIALIKELVKKGSSPLKNQGDIENINIVAITGIAGDIGSGLAKIAQNRGLRIKGLVREESLSKAYVRVGRPSNEIEYYTGDLLSKSLIKEMVHEVGAFYHFGAMVGQEFTPEQAAMVLAVNGFGTGLVTKVIKDLNKNIRFIYASSQRVYSVENNRDVVDFIQMAYNVFNQRLSDIDTFSNDKCRSQILKISQELLPKLPQGVNIYDISKLLGEKFARDLLNTTIARISNAYGPEYVGNRLIRRIITSRMSGIDIEVANETRDYIYSSDLNEILFKLGLKDGLPHIVDIASGVQISMVEVINAVLKFTPDYSSNIILKGPISFTFEQNAAIAKELLNRDFIDIETGLRNLIDEYRRMENHLRPTDEPYIMVFDIGGTSIRAGIFTSEKRIIDFLKIDSPNLNRLKGNLSDMQSELVSRISDIVEELRSRHHNRSLNTIGIAFAGPVNSEGLITGAATLWGKKGEDIRYDLAVAIKQKVSNIDNAYILNDNSAAALRYAHELDIEKLCVITIGSGISNKIYDKNHGGILMDEAGLTGEIGHMRIDFSPNAPICDCGKRGLLGALASGRAAERIARKMSLDGRDREIKVIEQIVAYYNRMNLGKIKVSHLIFGQFSINADEEYNVKEIPLRSSSSIFTYPAQIKPLWWFEKNWQSEVLLLTVCEIKGELKMTDIKQQIENLLGQLEKDRPRKGAWLDINSSFKKALEKVDLFRDGMEIELILFSCRRPKEVGFVREGIIYLNLAMLRAPPSDSDETREDRQHFLDEVVEHEVRHFVEGRQDEYEVEKACLESLFDNPARLQGVLNSLTDKARRFEARKWLQLSVRLKEFQDYGKSKEETFTALEKPLSVLSGRIQQIKDFEKFIPEEISRLTLPYSRYLYPLLKLYSTLKKKGSDAERLKRIDGLINAFVDKINLYTKAGPQELELATDILLLDDFLRQNRAEHYLERAKFYLREGFYIPQFLFAGAATRFGGPLYPVNLWLEAERLAQELETSGKEEEKQKASQLRQKINRAQSRLPLWMGPRQLIAYNLKIRELVGKDALKKQLIIIHVNEEKEQQILNDIFINNFYGFKRENVIFITQETFGGYTVDKNGELLFTAHSDLLPFGHGYNIQQLKQPYLAYILDEYGQKITIIEDVISYLREEFNRRKQELRLDLKPILSSHRINDLTKFTAKVREDIDNPKVFTTEVIDIKKFAYGLYLIEEGKNNMVIELLENPKNQKGGNLLYDKVRRKMFLIETSNTKGSPELTAILELGEKVPYNAFRIFYDLEELPKILEKGLPYNLRFNKGGYLYLEAVTGDITQLDEAKAVGFKKKGEIIHDCKEPKNLPEAVDFISQQDSWLVDKIINDPWLKEIVERVFERSKEVTSSPLTAADYVVFIPEELKDFVQINLGKVKIIGKNIFEIEKTPEFIQLQGVYQDRLKEILGLISHYITGPPVEVNVLIEPVQIGLPSMWFNKDTNTLHIQAILLTNMVDNYYLRLITYIASSHIQNPLISEQDLQIYTIVFLLENLDFLKHIRSFLTATKVIELKEKTLASQLFGQIVVYSNIYEREKLFEGLNLSLRRLRQYRLAIDVLLHDSVFSHEDKELVIRYLVFGKASVFSFWETLEKREKEELLEQMRTIDLQEIERLYFTFILQGIEDAKIIVTKDNLDIPECADLTLGDTEENLKAGEIGEGAFKRGEVAILELAGGSGARLGFRKPKGTFKASQVMNKSLFRMRAEKIRALADYYARSIPLIIMTSEVTHKGTVRFFEKHIVKDKDGNEYYFNQIPVDWVKFIRQRNMPQVTKDGEFILGGTEAEAETRQEAERKARYHIAVGGFGHGDARDWVLRNPEIRSWLKSFGVRYVMMVNVDNAYIPTPPVLGYHILSEKRIKPGMEHLSMLVVEKVNPREDVGMAVMLNGEDSLIEYTQVPRELTYLKYVYILDHEKLIFLKLEGARPTEFNYYILRLDEYLDKYARRITEPKAYEVWVTEHLISVDELPNGFTYQFLGRDYDKDTLARWAKLWLRLGNTNTIIWSLSSFEDEKYPLKNLPVVVAKDKALDGCHPETLICYTKADGILKAHKFEIFAFHGFLVGIMRGARVLVD